MVQQYETHLMQIHFGVNVITRLCPHDLMPFVREHKKFASTDRNSGANKRTPDCFRINGLNWQLDSKGTPAD